MTSRVRKISVLVASICCCMVLSACNTTEGVGRDVESLGKGVKETAQDNKPN